MRSLKKICTNLEISKKLQEIGIVEPTPWYWVWTDEWEIESVQNMHKYLNHNKYRAYSFEQILNRLPIRIKAQDIVFHRTIANKNIYYLDPISNNEIINLCIKNENNFNLATMAGKVVIEITKMRHVLCQQTLNSEQS